ncbi:MAG: hypothetical protein A2201_13645 [Alicyclobacillus sp. RIFOXYA1_FULL_53_8]|nr:MAG: hypothetical protein A2201_13645 [Alicyclobacillus sp. RIFOXYA1_FULL_53_8]
MNRCNLLFTSSGRRVELIQLFRFALDELAWDGLIVTADMSARAATAYVSDVHELVPSVSSPDYIPRLLELCQQHQIHLLIPLIDWELSLLAKHQADFERVGTKVAVSTQETCDLCFDKRQLSRYLKTIGLQSPALYNADEIDGAQFPVFLKPFDGSASRDARIIRNSSELKFFVDTIPNALIQEYVSGREYAIDGVVDQDGNVVCVVPRRQFEARSGEVSKGATERNSALIELGSRVLANLPGAFGCFTMDCIVADDGQVYVLDLNARFGGGMPLSIRSGANFPRWLLEICAGTPLHTTSQNWANGFMMLRYDQAIYVPATSEGGLVR